MTTVETKDEAVPLSPQARLAKGRHNRGTFDQKYFNSLWTDVQSLLSAGHTLTSACRHLAETNTYYHRNHTRGAMALEVQYRRERTRRIEAGEYTPKTGRIGYSPETKQYTGVARLISGEIDKFHHKIDKAQKRMAVIEQEIGGYEQEIAALQKALKVLA